MEFPKQREGIDHGNEAIGHDFPFHGPGHPERMKAPNSLPVLDQYLVPDREQRPAQRAVDDQFVIGPFHRRQRPAEGLDRRARLTRDGQPTSQGVETQ